MGCAVKKNTVFQVNVLSQAGKVRTLRYQDKTVAFDTRRGASYSLNGPSDRLSCW